MGCKECCKKCCTPKCLAITSFIFVPLNLFMTIFAITEKVRWNPVFVPMQCEPMPPMATRLSAISAPSPFAEMLGQQPGVEPFGLYMNLTTSVSCSNGGQADITIPAAGFVTALLAPNLTDLEQGGFGLPYKVSGEVRMAQDAVLPSGGQADMVTLTQLATPLEDILAGMGPSTFQNGYSVGFAKMKQAVKTCSSVTGMSACVDSTVELFCGSYSGNCLAEVLDTSGAPVVPAQTEPALCQYTAQLCGKEAEVHAQLDPAALGIQVVSQAPCAASTGLPNTTLCSVVSSPGVDPATFLPRSIETGMVFTTEEQARQAEMIKEEEGSLNFTIDLNLGLNGFFFFWNLLSGSLNLRKHLRSKAVVAPDFVRFPLQPPTLRTLADESDVP